MWVCIWEPDQHHFCTRNDKRSTDLAPLSPGAFTLPSLVLKTPELAIAQNVDFLWSTRTCSQATDTKITVRDIVMASC